MEIKPKIGQRIRFLREQASVSQKDLAYTADLDRSYIASVEGGCRNISIVNIERIANALNVSLKDFFAATEFDSPEQNSKQNQ